MVLPPEPVGPAPQLGIDDFSFRRGRKFGTTLVNLQTHQVLDLLPDRTAATAAACMSGHPEIELVSRVRGGDYAAAAQTCVPQAIQCADRFHLLHNLGTALEGVLARHLAAHRKRRTATTRTLPILTVEPSHRLAKKVALFSLRLTERLAQYRQVVVLREQGFSQTAMAQQVGIGHATVSRWLRHGAFPEQQPRPRKTSVDPHLSQFVERWETGCHTVAELYRDLVADEWLSQVRTSKIRELQGFITGVKRTKPL